MFKIAPSILSADFSCLGDEIKKVEKAGAEVLHFDVMDGHFVNNISFGIPVLESVSKITDMVMDVHLMIQNPEKYAERFICAGADIITVHHEADMDFELVKSVVKNHGKKLGISINPPTDASVLDKYINDVDLILIMSVNPGFGAQKFIDCAYDKLKYAKKLAQESLRDVEIEIDGGVNLDNIHDIVSCGADIVVAGSAIFKSNDIDETISQFRLRGTKGV